MLQKYSERGKFTQTSVSSIGTDSTWNGCLPQDCPTGYRSLTQLRSSIFFISSEVCMTNPAVSREPDLIRKGSGGFMFRRLFGCLAVLFYEMRFLRRGYLTLNCTTDHTECHCHMLEARAHGRSIFQVLLCHCGMWITKRPVRNNFNRL